jgi:hypothetical protein
MLVIFGHLSLSANKSFFASKLEGGSFSKTIPSSALFPKCAIYWQQRSRIYFAPKSDRHEYSFFRRDTLLLNRNAKGDVYVSALCKSWHIQPGTYLAGPFL